jgi:peptidyl-tRNA hydrolase
VDFIDAKKFVLQRFNRKEKKIVEQSVNLTSEAINFARGQGIEKAQAKYNF